MTLLLLFIYFNISFLKASFRFSRFSRFLRFSPPLRPPPPSNYFDLRVVILNYLRSHRLPELSKLNIEEKKELLDDAQYYGIHRLEWYLEFIVAGIILSPAF